MIDNLRILIDIFCSFERQYISMAPTVTQPSCYHKPGSDGIGVSEKEAKADGFTNKTSKQAIPLKNYLTGEVHYDTLYQNAEKVVINQK